MTVPAPDAWGANEHEAHPGFADGSGRGLKSKDNTKILVEVWSDLAVPSQMNEIRIDVSGSTEVSRETFPIAGQTQLPVRLTLVPRGTKDASLTVRAVALLGTAEEARQAAQGAFVPGEAKLLKLYIENLCTNAGCSAAQSCVAGACVPVPTIPNLTDYDAKARATPPDAGTQGSVDSGFDVGVREPGEVVPGKDASPDRVSDVAPIDAPMGAGGTGGDAAGASSIGGAGGDTVASSNTGGSSGGGGNGGKSSAGGVITLGGSSSTGTVILPPDAAVSDDAPIGGSAGGALGGAGSVGGASATGGASASAGTTTMGGTSAGSSSTTGGASATGGTSSATVVDCGSLGKPTNGSVTASITTVGSTARYSCDTGYKLTGSETRDCQANGTWSGGAPTCVLLGGTCSTTAGCPSNATCCDGSNQGCDGTRLPTGDSTNQGQFVVSENGLTVTDTITGLVCQRDGTETRAGCAGSGNLTCEWGQANDYCLGLTLSGFSDWRLPAAMELMIGLAVVLMPLAPPAAAPRCYPTSRFVVLASGMVQDTLTGLLWQQNGSGTRTGCTGDGNLTCTWAQAKGYCSGLTLGGLTGWRLPTVKELVSIADRTVTQPAINRTVFPSTSFLEPYWTSTPSARSLDGAWDVNFVYGSAYYSGADGYHRVRCVR